MTPETGQPDHGRGRPPSRRVEHIVGVGGIVIRERRVVLVRLTYSDFRGRYMLPGGVLKNGESLGDAIVREVAEETGIIADVEGLIAARSRLHDASTNVYLVFQMRYVAGEPRPDGRENDDVRLFTLEDLETSDRQSGPVVPYARHLSLLALRGDVRLLGLDPYVPSSLSPGVLGWQGFV